MQPMVIQPYIGVGPIRLGTPPEDVARIVGTPGRVTTNRRGRREEHRDGFIVRYAKNANTVDEVTLFPPASPVLLGIDLFAEPERFVEVCAADGSPFEDVGFLWLFNLGVLLTGFHDNDRAQLAVSVVERGLVNESDPRLKRFDTAAHRKS
jgi:hypothetical protein